MTVKELRERLEKYDENQTVMAAWEGVLTTIEGITTQKVMDIKGEWETYVVLDVDV